MLQLWKHQKEALQAVEKSFNNNIHRQILSLPTGAGKTIIIIGIAQHFQQKATLQKPCKIIILAHRDELITQTYDKFKIFAPEADVTIFKGSQHNLDHQVTISSIQTCTRRIQQLKETDFTILIIDEAHHAPSASYERIITELGFMHDPSKLLIGVTATPTRADSKSLDNIFQQITYSVDIESLIKEGYLSPVIARRILTNFKISGVKTIMGDFATGELAKAVNTTLRNEFVVTKWKEHAIDRKTIAFCTNVQHCQDLAKQFNDNGIVAAAVWGNMNEKLRKQTLDDFKQGKITVITSCGILTEGFDEPSVACIIMARPTKSSGLYIQMVGRGLRVDSTPNSTKKNCLVLDFTDIHNNLKSVISIQNIMPNVPVILDESIARKTDQNSRSGQRYIKSDITTDEEFNILAIPKFLWIKVGDGHSLSDDYGNEIVIHNSNGSFIAYLYREGVMRELIIKPCLALLATKIMCEDYAQDHLTTNYSDAHSNWYIKNLKLDPTDGQIRQLEAHQVYDTRLSRASASTRIRKIVAESKSKQRITAYNNNKPTSQNKPKRTPQEILQSYLLK